MDEDDNLPETSHVPTCQELLRTKKNVLLRSTQNEAPEQIYVYTHNLFNKLMR